MNCHSVPENNKKERASKEKRRGKRSAISDQLSAKGQMPTQNMKKPITKPHHESTKVRRHERRGGHKMIGLFSFLPVFFCVQPWGLFFS
jgi:hypothetical protein